MQILSFIKKVICEHIAAVILLLIVLILSVSSIKNKSITADEPYHYNYGLQILNLDSNRIFNSKMPFSCLNAIPQFIGSFTGTESYQMDINKARYVTILFSLLLAVFVYKWSRELYGPVPSFFSLVFYAFSPNIIAHSRLVTTDLFAACMATIALYYFWKFTKNGGWHNGALSAFTLGLSQLTKYTCIYLYPMFILIIVARYWKHFVRAIRSGNRFVLMRDMTYFIKYALLYVVISILIINAGFLFNSTFTPLGEYRFRSDLLKSIQTNLKLFHKVPVPLPYPYVQGLDWVKNDERDGTGSGNVYLLGRLSLKGENFSGFKGYFFYACLYKVPIPILIFILASVVYYLFKRRDFNFSEDEVFLFCPILFFTIYFNFFFRLQIGLRFLLVIFPLLHIFCGIIFKNWNMFPGKIKGFVWLLIIYLIVSVQSYYPHYLSYFNELVPDRKKAYKILADSNLDWGQNEYYLEQYRREYPDIIVDPISRVSGRIVVSVNRLVGVYDPGRYKWLRNNFEPIDHIAYSYLVFDIPENDIEPRK